MLPPRRSRCTVVPGGHSSPPVGVALRAYLIQEWLRKQAERKREQQQQKPAGSQQEEQQDEEVDEPTEERFNRVRGTNSSGHPGLCLPWLLMRTDWQWTNSCIGCRQHSIAATAVAQQVLSSCCGVRAVLCRQRAGCQEL